MAHVPTDTHTHNKQQVLFYFAIKINELLQQVAKVVKLQRQEVEQNFIVPSPDLQSRQTSQQRKVLPAGVS